MKIAIISDIHDNQVNLKKTLGWCNDNKVETIFCLGDVTNEDTLQLLSAGFKDRIFLVEGNSEIYKENKIAKYANINNGGRVSIFNIDGLRVGLCHEPYLINRILKDGKVTHVFYGHTHKPWIEDAEGAKIINPGTLGGVFSRATFALWDTNTKKLDLKILDLL